MSKYYMLSFDHNGTRTAMALGGVRWDIIEPGVYIDTWKTITFEYNYKKMPDFLPNIFGWNICSAKLMQVMQQFANGHTYLQWLPVQVESHGNTIEYHVLNIYERIAALHDTATLWANKENYVYVRPVLDKAMISDQHIFSVPKSFTHVYISDSVRSEIVKSRCTGTICLSVSVK